MLDEKLSEQIEKNKSLEGKLSEQMEQNESLEGSNKKQTPLEIRKDEDDKRPIQSIVASQALSTSPEPSILENKGQLLGKRRSSEL